MRKTSGGNKIKFIPYFSSSLLLESLMAGPLCFILYRCVAEGDGDVAFVKYSTVTDNTDGNNQEAWARDLHSEDYELLCKDGSRAAVGDWQSCHIARVPSHAVMTSSDKSAPERTEIWNLLDSAQVDYLDIVMFH